MDMEKISDSLTLNVEQVAAQGQESGSDLKGERFLNNKNDRMQGEQK